MVPLGKTLTNMIGFREQNKRLAERKSGQRDHDHDFPRQRRHPVHSQPRLPAPLPGEYGRPRYTDPRMPYMGPPLVYRNDGQLIPHRQLDGRRIDRPNRHRGALLRLPPYEDQRDLPEFPSCDEYDDELYDPHWDPYDDESIIDSLGDLSLGRRHSYERFRPVGRPDHRHLTPHPPYRYLPARDHGDHYHPHDRHHHHQDHQYQHGHSPYRGHHEHHDSLDSDDFPGGNRVSGGWERDPHRIGHVHGHGHSADESSEHGSTSTW